MTQEATMLFTNLTLLFCAISHATRRAAVAIPVVVIVSLIGFALPAEAQSSPNATMVHQGSSGIPGINETHDWFGNSLAWGDFNGDGYPDLAIGSYLEDLAVPNVGRVVVIYGYVNGLTNTVISIDQELPGLQGASESLDRFGFSVAAGDFNGDGNDDLAIGADEERIGATGVNHGAVFVLYGEPVTGLTGIGSDIFHRATPGIPRDLTDNDRFGHKLVAGDFNGDNRDDLAIGAPGGAGSLAAIYGSASGLDPFTTQDFDQNVFGIPDFNEDGDLWSTALASGDFNGDGHDDIAIGARQESIGSGSTEGAVTVVYGTSGGLTPIGSDFFHQDTPGIPGAGEVFDIFGTSVAAGDFDNDGWDDLSIGTPNESIGSAEQAGAITILRGSAAGLTTTGAVMFHQDKPGMPGRNETGDGFGGRQASADFNGDGFDDLAIGARGEDIGAGDGNGAVTVMLGASAGLSSQGAVIYHQGSPGMPGANEDGDLFSEALAATDSSLAIGAPREAIGPLEEAGAVTILDW